MVEIVHVEKHVLEECQKVIDEEMFRQSAIAEGFCLHFNGDQGVQVWLRTGEEGTPVSTVGYTTEEALFKLLRKYRPEISNSLKEQITKRFQDICKHDGKRHYTNHGAAWFCDLCCKRISSL